MPASKLVALSLKPGKEGAFFARHPWVLAKSLLPAADWPADGDEVDLLTNKGSWIARGIYNGRSHIRVRLYSWTAHESLDEAFWQRRLAAAIAWRRQIGYDHPTGSARLVFSEADGISGLIVDRYCSYLVVQVTALAIQQRLDVILRQLVEALNPSGISVRTDPKIVQAEGLTAQEGCVWGEPLPPQIDLSENGLTFRVDLGAGQKTGYYLDQRENRRVAASYLRDRRVLDVCCYVGGFSLAAARLGPASEVLGLDASEKAVSQAALNADLNQIRHARFEVGDCFQGLEQLASAGARFGGVILDPPRFAGSRQSIDQALRAYHRLNRLAVQVLEPEGILVTCSCSGRVTREDFGRMLGGVAQKTRRDIQVVESRGSAPDHPVVLSCPETEYLKCFICRVH